MRVSLLTDVGHAFDESCDAPSFGESAVVDWGETHVWSAENRRRRRVAGGDRDAGAWPVGKARVAVCSQSVVKKIQKQLLPVTQLSDQNGGIFKPNRMWSAVVDRDGRLCSIIRHRRNQRRCLAGKSSRSRSPRPKPQTISATPRSPCRQRTSTAPTQPGGSLYGLNNSNPFNPVFRRYRAFRRSARFPAAIITFGGGVALYSGGQVIGGLGVSGDSSCADHAIAYRMRAAAGFGSVPAGVAPGNTDNIIYAPAGDAADRFPAAALFPIGHHRPNRD